MIIGSHSIIYSKDAEADRKFLRDVMRFPSVDVGEGWLIFGLPPSEVAVHPTDEDEVHEFYLMVDDVQAFVEEMKSKGVPCGEVKGMGWGDLTMLQLPGGGTVGVYQPRHARPETIPGQGAGRRQAARPARRPTPGRSTKKAAKPARSRGASRTRKTASRGPAKRPRTRSRRR